MVKQDIALPYKKDKKVKKGSLKKFFKNLSKDSPKNKLVRVTTYAGLVLAVVAFILALIPLVNEFGIWLAVLAVALELFGFFKKDGKLPKIMLVISAVVLVIAGASVAIENIYNQSLIDRQMYLESGEATDELLDKDVSVSFEDWNEDGLEIKIKNNNQDSKGYGILIEAKSKDGKTTINEMVNISAVTPGKSTTMTIFKRLTEAQREALKDAEFNILSISQF